MSEHSSAAFNHSCLKVPVNPVNRMPSPAYEQKHFNQLKNEALRENDQPSTRRSCLSSDNRELIDFYDSIPDYSDVNHLSNRDFYRKLDVLKAKQKNYHCFLGARYDVENEPEIRKTKPKTIQRKTPSLRATPETDDSLSSCSKENIVAPPSRRSVRIESPKSDSTAPCNSPKRPSPIWKRNISSADSKLSESSKFISSIVDSVCDDDKNYYGQIEDILKEPSCSTSLPSSPTKTRSIVWNDCGITIPKPFKMTIRDEEDKLVEEILARNKKTKNEKPEMFRAHQVPIESQIPLFDKIMEEQEMRRQIVKRRSKDNLKSKMKPFSFTKREEEEQALTRRLSKSSPQLSFDCAMYKTKPFKAKPVPKNLFSNYVYAKMHEDEFYRSLKKRIRAEEMLKASNLPPSMAQRAKKQGIEPICPRALREIEKDIDDEIRRHETESICRRLESESDGRFTPSCREFSFRKRSQKRAASAKRCHRANEYADTESKRAQSALELQSVNRSNLAAVLRIQSARRRMEREMSTKLEEQKFQEEMRWREKVMRGKPVWQELSYTSQDDIAIRLQMRKDEERLRQEEHRHHMDVMMGRVQQIPTLFERQSNLR